MAFLQQIWSIGGYVVPFVFVLSVVVFFHELGHFLIGRLCGVKVDVFSLGLGPELFALCAWRSLGDLAPWRFAHPLFRHCRGVDPAMTEEKP